MELNLGAKLEEQTEYFQNIYVCSELDPQGTHNWSAKHSNFLYIFNGSLQLKNKKTEHFYWSLSECHQNIVLAAEYLVM